MRVKKTFFIQNSFLEYFNPLFSIQALFNNQYFWILHLYPINMCRFLQSLKTLWQRPIWTSYFRMNKNPVVFLQVDRISYMSVWALRISTNKNFTIFCRKWTFSMVGNTSHHVSLYCCVMEDFENFIILIYICLQLIFLFSSFF